MSDWSLPDEVFEYLRAHLPPMFVHIVELGSGDGTLRLREFGPVTSIEHDETFIRHHPGADFIHAPIKDGWYDPDAIRGRLPVKYDCLIVDGPPGAIGRMGLLKHLDLFQRVPIIVDDVHRPAERELALGLAHARDEGLSIHCLKGGRGFATIGWPL